MKQHRFRTLVCAISAFLGLEFDSVLNASEIVDANHEIINSETCKPTTCIIDRMPHEVLLLTLENLSPIDLISASSTSRKFHTLCDDYTLALLAWNKHTGPFKLNKVPPVWTSGLKIQHFLARLDQMDPVRDDCKLTLINKLSTYTPDVDKILCLYKYRTTFFKGVDPDDILYICKAFSRLSTPQITELYANRERYLSVIPRRGGYTSIIRAISLLSTEEIKLKGELIFANAKDLFSRNIHHYPLDVRNDFQTRACAKLLMLTVKQITAMTANHSHFLTGEMDNNHRLDIFSALLPLDVTQIQERGVAITANRSYFISEDMSAHAQTLVITTLLKLTGEQIHSFAQQNAHELVNDVLSFGRVGKFTDDGQYISLSHDENDL